MQNSEDGIIKFHMRLQEKEQRHNSQRAKANSLSWYYSPQNSCALEAYGTGF